MASFCMLIWFFEIILYLHHFPSLPPSKPSHRPLLALSKAQLPRCLLLDLTGEMDEGVNVEGTDVATIAADAFGELSPLFSLGKDLGTNWVPQLVSRRRPEKAYQAFPRPQLSRLKEKPLLLLLLLLCRSPCICPQCSQVHRLVTHHFFFLSCIKCCFMLSPKVRAHSSQG